ncbi:Glycoside-hydrolase family GH114 [Nonlabens sp. Hel1_33_55]|uniref:endo alpha-1,4 polygalactosaminidase n=1 Tax=Nonlabens sp. Hel1_33_55 TaxID=1336802 RepID=UPI000875E7B6|nr:endo alpha-1,4 polygalactosaminidase [Nonlabens sp. Hel1_33_55]SCX96830.1 Glycoside-hydrolase family GH114 [Nonlabens sp. Hel1_33_55]
MKSRSFLGYIFILLGLLSCSSEEDYDTGMDPNNPPVQTGNGRFENGIFIPTPGTTFEWRLDDLPNNFQANVDVIDIDAFAATPELVANLQAQGTKVIAYLSVGSFENFREDAGSFPAGIKGNRYEDFPDENWLDVRQIDIIGPIMEARLDMIKAKGFDGIEPDNINGYQNNTGFNLTEQDAITYSKWLIREAHERGLSIAQKNAEELIPIMVNEFDWFLAEDAYVENFYQQLEPYINANKAVFLVEYTDRINRANFNRDVCPVATQLQYTSLLKNRDLTNTTFYCY